MYLFLAFFGLAVFFWGFAANADRKNRMYRENTWKEIHKLFDK